MGSLRRRCVVACGLVVLCCTARAATWTSNVNDGWSYGEGKALSTAGILGYIQSDNGDAVSEGKVYADKGDTIGGQKWLSVYFNSDFPTDAGSIQSVKVYVDHQGPSGKSGTLVVHVSDDKGSSGWYNGATGSSDANSGNVSWNGSEQRYEFDVTAILDTPGKINNCEVLILNKGSSDDKIYFDYAYIEVQYVVEEAPTITSAPPAKARKDAPYSHTFAASGTPAVFTWTITAGTLPTGISLIGDQLTGTPTVIETQTGIEVTCSNGVPSDATQTFTITVADVDPSLVAWYKLDETTGTTAPDASGSGNSGTLVGGPAWQPAGGKIDGALELDGSDDHVALGDPASLQITGEITIAAWVKPEASNGLRNVVAKGHTSNPDQEMFLRINSGKYQIGSWNGSDHLASSNIPGGDIGSWVHLTGLYDGSAWRLYRNGAEVSSSADATGAIQVDEAWAIGARGTGTERFFDGLLDDVQIYNRALSAFEVEYLHSLGFPPSAPAITSTAPTEIYVGHFYSYTITRTGSPTPTLDVSGLPGWLSWDAGTRTLSGTPGSGDAGETSPITVTATNSEGTDQ